MYKENLAVNITNLSAYYENFKALNNISITIEQGTVFGYLGPNGSGKTTTIKVLLGLMKPQTGSAFVLGHNVIGESDKIREQSGILMEHHGLYETLSAEDNLEFYCRIWGLSRHYGFFNHS